MTDYKQVFEDYLKTQNLLLTPQRLSILDAVLSIDSHFDAEILLEIVQKTNKNVSRATVYRTIPLLIDAGLLSSSDSMEEKESYECVLGNTKHFHLLCTVCNNILEEDESKDLLDLLNKACKKNKFKMNDYILTIKGVCRACKK
ncbi:MAG: Fur family transcriptional regulator [Candidatus Cloacimonadales bacterium]|jgi:Fur family ferric uptake transcriptional regulator|nr:transcriptional repressor [Candidatus Cloacimonadota bacterium]MDX9978365.1 Fur family transcriptional regulator [Candidatus Cloacimonadales bacterium]